MNVIKPGTKMAKHFVKFFAKHSNVILSAIAWGSAVALIPTTIYGTIKAIKLKEEKKVEGVKETVKTVWKCYIPTVGLVLITTIAIFSNGKLNARKIATLTGLYATTRSDLADQTHKIKEMFGEGKAQKVKDELAKDEVEKAEAAGKFTSSDIHETGHGNQIFLEHLTGQIFKANVDYIQLVQERTNNALKDEIDNVVQFGYPADMLSLRNCGMFQAFWDLEDMKEHGYSAISFDTSACKWIELDGEQKMISELWIRPAPSGLF